METRTRRLAGDEAEARGAPRARKPGRGRARIGKPGRHNVPRYVPPIVPRPARRPGLVRGLAMFARNILSVFPEAAFSARSFRFRALRRDVLVVNAPELVREAFVERHAALERKSPQMRRGLGPLLGDGLFISDGKTWSDRRGTVAAVVHARNLPAFFPVMTDVADEWRARWEGLAGGPPVDVLHEMGDLTAEVITRSVFGSELGREHAAEIVGGFAEFQHAFDNVDLHALLDLPGWVPRPPRPGVDRAVRRITRVVDHLVERLIAARDDPAVADTFVVKMLNARDANGRPFSPEAIRNEAIVTFLAGQETTATTLAWALFLLSEADWARERLRTETDRVLGGRIPTLEDLPRLAYTRAVVDETLRLYPPIPVLGREAVEGTMVADETIRPGTQVTVAPWLLHRNPKLWRDPDRFLPERFLPGRRRAGKYAYVPFSAGPRTCPGLVFGQTEAIVCLAVLESAFDLALAPGARIEPMSRGTLRPGVRLPMTLARRPDAPAFADGAPDP